jgi:hypothetical protein
VGPGHADILRYVVNGLAWVPMKGAERFMMSGCGRAKLRMRRRAGGDGDVLRASSEVTLGSWRGSNGHDESKGHEPQEGRQSRERPAKLFA